jgi:hypothetical protein
MPNCARDELTAPNFSQRQHDVPEATIFLSTSSVTDQHRIEKQSSWSLSVVLRARTAAEPVLRFRASHERSADAWLRRE